MFVKTTSTSSQMGRNRHGLPLSLCPRCSRGGHANPDVFHMAEAAPTDVTIKSAKAGNFRPVFVVGLTCAYDYAATIINIQQYFGLIGGVCA